MIKISIVTAVYNGEDYIEDCIKSIMNQTYKNYEHIIMDGGSSDKTLEIINRYKDKYPVKVYSQKDEGMYDAIVNGFRVATGDIFCWLNSDDILFPWAFDVMQQVFNKTSAQWCTGFPTYWNEDATRNRCQYSVSGYRQSWLSKGYYDGQILPVIQQESTFWSRNLWERANGKLIRKYKYAGDYFLWKEFSKYEPIYKINSPISGFRIHTGQKSENIEAYYKEINNNSILHMMLRKTGILRKIDMIYSMFSKRYNLLMQNLFRQGTIEQYGKEYNKK